MGSISALAVALSTSADSSIHLAQYNVHAAQNHHHVRDDVTQAQIFENRQINETRRAHPITIRIRPTVAEEIKTKFAFRGLDTGVRFARLGAESANLRLGIHDRAGRNVAQ